MFIAHLPAGYLLSQLHPVLKRRQNWVMAGAILPDIDMIYFILVDNGLTHHHSYLTHRPILWATLLILSFMLRKYVGARPLCAVAIRGLLHLILDSVVGAIGWGWPIWSGVMPLVTVPARYDWWVLSFLTHWTFGVELVICLCAACLWSRQMMRYSGRLR